MDKKRKWLIAVTLLLFLCFGTAWLFGAFSGTSSQLAKVQEMRKELEENKDLTPEQRREKWEAMREESEKLTKDERRQLRRGRNNGFGQQMQKRMDHYFELSPEQRKVELDKQIEEMETWRKRWEEQANSDSRRNRGPDRNASSQNQDGGNREGNRDGNRNRWREMDRQTRTRAMLDSTTADQRAKWAEHRLDMDKRRAELGLPPMRGPGGWGGRGR